jgi:hypothetical protein
VQEILRCIFSVITFIIPWKNSKKDMFSAAQGRICTSSAGGVIHALFEKSVLQIRQKLNIM